MFMSYIASDGDRLERFCAQTGFGQNDITSALATPAFQAFLLDYALQDESLLLAFAADQGLAPESIIAARRKLPGFGE